MTIRQQMTVCTKCGEETVAEHPGGQFDGRCRKCRKRDLVGPTPEVQGMSATADQLTRIEEISLIVLGDRRILFDIIGEPESRWEASQILGALHKTRNQIAPAAGGEAQFHRAIAEIRSRSKVCDKCGRNRPFDVFPEDESTADGRGRICGECRPHLVAVPEIEDIPTMLGKIERERNRQEETPVDTKPCTKCAVEKPLDEFYKSKAAKDGRTPHCKECQRKATRARKARKKAEAAAPSPEPDDDDEGEPEAVDGSVGFAGDPGAGMFDLSGPVNIRSGMGAYRPLAFLEDPRLSHLEYLRECANEHLEELDLSTVADFARALAKCEPAL